MSIPRARRIRTANDSSSTKIANSIYSLPTGAPGPSWSMANSQALSNMLLVRGVNPLILGSLVQRADKRRAVCGFAHTHRRQDFTGAALGNVEYAEQDVFAAHIRRSVIPGGIQRKFDGFLQIDGKFTEVVHISPCGQPPASV